MRQPNPRHALETGNAFDQRWLDRYEQLERHIATHGGRLTQLDRNIQLRNWVYQQRLAHAEGRLTTDREQLLRELPGLLEADNRSQVTAFITAAHAWMKQTGQRMDQLAARDTVTISNDAGKTTTINVGKKAVYYRRRYTGLETGYGLEDHEIQAIEALPGWTWETPNPSRRSRAALTSPGGHPRRANRTRQRTRRSRKDPK